MSSAHGEVGTLVQNNREKMCFRSAAVICNAAVELLFSGTVLFSTQIEEGISNSVDTLLNALLVIESWRTMLFPDKTDDALNFKFSSGRIWKIYLIFDYSRKLEVVNNSGYWVIFNMYFNCIFTKPFTHIHGWGLLLWWLDILHFIVSYTYRGVDVARGKQSTRPL